MMLLYITLHIDGKKKKKDFRNILKCGIFL